MGREIFAVAFGIARCKLVSNETSSLVFAFAEKTGPKMTVSNLPHTGDHMFKYKKSITTALALVVAGLLAKFVVFRNTEA